VGHGPENMIGLRRFAVGLLKSHAVKNISKKMTKNTQRACSTSRLSLEEIRSGYWLEC
jgi:hypothetical protein